MILIIIIVMNANSPNAASTDALTVTYSSGNALENVSLDLPRGSSVAILGPNGAGKTTLLHSLAGLTKPSSGEVRVESMPIALVPQELSVEPMFPVTASDVVRMGRYGSLGLLGRMGERDRELVEQAIDRLEVRPFAEERFGTLSGGQRRRALLAQVAAQDANLICLDEPFAGVDAPTVQTIRQLISDWRDDGRTVLVTTHDLESSARDYDLVVALNREVVAFGPARTTLTEEVLTETFAGRIARVGDFIVDTAHHHHGAG
jgi:ABC-type Mn2+/Zn2+ transport system ATPase subunit